ncbi:MAG: FAD-binding protein [Proteobacteria bacterium]|nr:FAD-binding protein [Pseudomonadota bacterium]
MSVLVIAEHNNKSLKSSTLNTVRAALEIDTEVHILVCGFNNDEVVKQTSVIEGIIKVIQINDHSIEHQLAEHLSQVLVQISKNYTHILAPSTTFGKNFMPRAAAILDVSQISDISAVVSADTFVRPIYAGNAIATVQSSDLIKFITVRPTSFEAVESSGGNAMIEKITFNLEEIKTKFVNREEAQSERPELGNARIVISGGRGLESADNFKLLNEIADKLNAAVGASRAAVDAGYIGNECQVGQTGKMVAPELYIAVGISGAIQHLAGMKESKIIVAINKDEDAPIFAIADYGLKADLFVALPEFSKELDLLNNIAK